MVSKMGGLVKPAEMAIWATHNHYAPPLDPGKPKLGQWSEQYFHYATDLVSKLIIRLTQEEPKEGYLSYGYSQNDRLTINRRKKGLYLERKSPIFRPHWGMLMLPNERKYRNGKISTISIRDVQGKQLALIWNFACHPVSSPGKNDVRSDYPGEIRRLLRTQTHSEIPVVFLQGFSGDLKPPSFEKVPRNSGFKRKISYHMMNIINGKSFSHFDEQEWPGYITSIWDATKAASDRFQSSEVRARLGVEIERSSPKQTWTNK